MQDTLTTEICNICITLKSGINVEFSVLIRDSGNIRYIGYNNHWMSTDRQNIRLVRAFSKDDKQIIRFYMHLNLPIYLRKIMIQIRFDCQPASDIFNTCGRCSSKVCLFIFWGDVQKCNTIPKALEGAKDSSSESLRSSN